MKTKFLFILFLVITVIGCKSDKSGKKEQQAQQTQKFEQQDYFFPPEVYYFQSRVDYLVDRFYPIGWSAEGNFAYITEPADEGLGVYVFEITVINVISGDTLWYWHSDYNEDLVREEVWKNNYDYFKSMLNKYHIVQLKEPKLLSPYFTYQGDDFSVELETDYEKFAPFGYDRVSHTRIIIRSPQRGVKIAYEEDEPKNSLILTQTVAGVMISPFDDKILIVLLQERPGYEGPPNVITFKLVGSNLSAGWNYQL